MIPGRSVLLHEAFEDLIFKWVSGMGWINIIMMLNEFYYPSLVEEFYRNLERSDGFDQENVAVPVIKSKVRGKIIVLQTFDLQRIFQIPNTGKRFFIIKSRTDLEAAIEPLTPREYYASFLHIDTPPGQLQTWMLQDGLKTLHLWLIANVVPKSGHKNEITTLEGYILHCMKTATPLNLPVIILNYMHDAAQNSLKGRPYAGLLTTIFQEYGVDFEGVRKVKIDSPINLKTLRLQESHLTQETQSRRRRTQETSHEPDQNDWPSWQPQGWQPQPWVNEDAYHPVMPEPDEDYTATQDLNIDNEYIDPAAFDNMHNFNPWAYR